jgi:death-on-curing protein
LHTHFSERRQHGEWFDFGSENPVALVAEAAKLLSPFSTAAGPSTSLTKASKKLPTYYLDVLDVVDIATRAVGSDVEVADWPLLIHVTQRPQASLFGEDAHPTLFEKAAALLHSLASNHALVDGNKRTAWASAIVFLDLNGHELEEFLDEDAAEELVLAVAQSQLEIAEIADRLRYFVKYVRHPVSSPEPG